MFQNNVIAYLPELKPFAYKLTQNTMDSEDLIQETMFKALSNEDKFREGTNLKAWLYTIMKNIFINGYRKKVKQATFNDSSEGSFFLNSVDCTMNTAEATIEKDYIMKTVRKLSIEYRIPFMLHYKGYKYNEIAEKLNLPLGTVKSRIFFARKELQQLLAAYRR